MRLNQLIGCVQLAEGSGVSPGIWMARFHKKAKSFLKPSWRHVQPDLQRLCCCDKLFMVRGSLQYSVHELLQARRVHSLHVTSVQIIRPRIALAQAVRGVICLGCVRIRDGYNNVRHAYVKASSGDSVFAEQVQGMVQLEVPAKQVKFFRAGRVRQPYKAQQTYFVYPTSGRFEETDQRFNVHRPGR